MKLIFSILLSFFISCSSDERVDKLTMLRMAQKADPTVKPLIAESLGGGIRCKEESGKLIYGPGCIGAFKAQVQILDLTILEFDSKESAIKEAKRIGQYQYKNWVFDEVSGEPLLENFVKKAFNAKKWENVDKK